MFWLVTVSSFLTTSGDLRDSIGDLGDSNGSACFDSWLPQLVRDHVKVETDRRSPFGLRFSDPIGIKSSDFSVFIETVDISTKM